MFFLLLKEQKKTLLAFHFVQFVDILKHILLKRK